MLHETRNSEVQQITASANNISDDSIDCGISALGWCRGASCQKFASLRTFVLCLALAGLLQGAAESYFRVSAKQAALQYDYSPLIVDWLLVSSGIFQGILALGYTHWAHKLQPLKWLTGTLMLQSVACVLALIPAFMHFNANGNAPVIANLESNSSMCVGTYAQLQRLTLTTEQSSTLTLVLLFVLQLALGLASIGYYTIGLTYLDDNSRSTDSPAVLATSLAARVIGLQFGAFLVLGVGATHMGWWLGWAALAPLIFFSALLLGLFPRQLPTTAVHQAAQRIMAETRTYPFSSAQQHVAYVAYIDDVDYWPTLKRLLSNKLLLCNLAGAMFVQSAVVNYAFEKERYLQSRFYLAYNEQDGLKYEWKATFVGYFLIPPANAIGMLIAGLIIAKIKLSGRAIATLNVIFGLLLVVLYVCNILIACDVGPMAGVVAGKLTQPYCARQCICKPTAFMPVCPENSTTTYFSPCYAGCQRRSVINDIELYEGCSCASDYDAQNAAQNIRATSGACSAYNCERMLIIFELLSVLAAAIVGMSTIGKLLITLRSVLPQDKGLALASELLLIGIIGYGFVHFAYSAVTLQTCIYWAPNYERCLMHETPKHGNILNIYTASLIACGVCFDLLVCILSKGLNLYNCNATDDNYSPSLYSPVPHYDVPNTNTTATATTTTNTTTATATATTTATATATVVQANRLPLRPPRPPKSYALIQRQSNSTTNSSSGEQGSSITSPTSSITYAQVQFPNNSRNNYNNGNTSGAIARTAVASDVPLQQLTAQDVRAQLHNLQSFNKVKSAEAANADEMRAQSPQTDF